jgi:hypothetical protein
MEATKLTKAKTVDMKLEAIVIPVSDANVRSSSIANSAGGRTSRRPAQAFSQFTPRGSACSVQFGTNLNLCRAWVGAEELLDRI